jgi:hypothetical protein
MSEMTPEEFWAILHAPVETKPIFFRLYYNDDGTPFCYSMEDLPGNYIDIDCELFVHSPSNVRVVNGKLTFIEPQRQYTKLRPGFEGTSCDPRNVAVVVSDKDPHTKWSLITK